MKATVLSVLVVLACVQCGAEDGFAASKGSSYLLKVEKDNADVGETMAEYVLLVNGDPCGYFAGSASSRLMSLQPWLKPGTNYVRFKCGPLAALSYSILKVHGTNSTTISTGSVYKANSNAIPFEVDPKQCAWGLRNAQLLKDSEAIRNGLKGEVNKLARLIAGRATDDAVNMMLRGKARYLEQKDISNVRKILFAVLSSSANAQVVEQNEYKYIFGKRLVYVYSGLWPKKFNSALLFEGADKSGIAAFGALQFARIDDEWIVW